MGIFDRFKSKDTTEPTADLFTALKKYHEYIVQFIHFQQRGNYAPIAAYENADGTTTGFLYINADNTYTLDADEVVIRIERELNQRLAQHSIRSYVMLYHSPFTYAAPDHTVASRNEDLKAITVAYALAAGQTGKLGLPYTYSDTEGFSYSGIQEFTQEQNTHTAPAHAA